MLQNNSVKINNVQEEEMLLKELCSKLLSNGCVYIHIYMNLTKYWQALSELSIFDFSWSNLHYD